MSKLESIKKKARVRDTDPAEWDADDPAGDESFYDGLAVETVPYDHSQFEGGEE